jgi:hypothetical protein
LFIYTVLPFYTFPLVFIETVPPPTLSHFCSYIQFSPHTLSHFCSKTQLSPPTLSLFCS